MATPRSATLVIVCPHCGTRYQLAADLLGGGGRQVACAECGKAWQASAADALPALPPPEPDRLFSRPEEAALDAEFDAEEKAARLASPAALDRLLGDGNVPPEVLKSIAEIRAAVTPKVAAAARRPAAAVMDVPERRRIDRDLAERYRRMTEDLPLARMRRLVRVVSTVTLFGLLAGGILFRSDIVRAVPDLAGLYRLIGLEVNVVGLDFTDVSTLMSRRDGQPVLDIDATIVGRAARLVVVPPVLVTLLGADGATLYAWSVTPAARDLKPGEVIGFSTELPNPPAAIASVRLSFAGSGLAESRPARSGQIETAAPATHQTAAAPAAKTEGMH